MQSEERPSDSLVTLIAVLNELAEQRAQVLRVLYALGNVNPEIADAEATQLNKRNKARLKDLDETTRVLVMHAMQKGQQQWLSQSRAV
ncbi:hypothetical protein [uncultured Rothia sp.]|uniref:hypothetical protein n=1 Tax=uncultured Rothia sp. TaxID=316088 RepID=UPI002635E685|nr:hypothetical protein [uncultured Rothia sp.]